jgi:4-amino-4-deoxy-L-arabinose transferase-like glycosyltransferase
MSLFGNRIEIMITVACFVTAAAIGFIGVVEKPGWWIWLLVGAACAGGVYSLGKGMEWW